MCLLTLEVMSGNGPFKFKVTMNHNQARICCLAALGGQNLRELQEVIVPSMLSCQSTMSYGHVINTPRFFLKISCFLPVSHSARECCKTAFQNQIPPLKVLR